MLQLFNQVLMKECLEPYQNRQGFERYCRELGMDGGEGIWGGVEIPEEYKDPALFPGYHLIFFSDWLDFWLEDTRRLDQKFGSRQVWQDFYQGTCREDMFRQYQADVDRAAALGCQYVVFHVSDVSIEETYGGPREHADELVIDAAAEVINRLLDGKGYQFDFLMENLWWPGLTMADPEMTARLLEKVHYEKKGIMLDTGHLLNTNPELKNEDEGIDYIRDRVAAHGPLARYIKGLHLHCSISGAYVKDTYARYRRGEIKLAEDYLQRFSDAYDRLYTVDAHAPFASPRIAELVEEIGPKYLVHELAGQGDIKTQRLRTQRRLFA